MNPLLDLAVFPSVEIDTETLKTSLERTPEKGAMTTHGDHFIMSYTHRSDGRRVDLKLKGVYQSSGLGVLLPAPVAVFLFEVGSPKPFKFTTLYAKRPSEFLIGDEGPLYLEACASAWSYIESHSSLKRGDI